MSNSRQIITQTSTSSSRVSSASRVEEETANARITGTLRLRAEDTTPASRDQTPTRHIRWSEDVVDNEGMGKKSSKVCCIYHKTRPVGESSSESESSSDPDSSDSDSDPGAERSRSRRNCRQPHNHRDPAQDSPERGRTSGSRGRDSDKGKRRMPSPNAYEKMPKHTKG
ncbi:phosphatase inhibitor-domain-containing protein [Aspergillus egyptiacus]|nr:phosphatase inhibitor-domain-containing protein [Aspergillus egyptiacus]